IKQPQLLIRTMEILPEYLRNNTRGLVNDYRDWGIPLGRRFRSLKLWFVLRHMGLANIRKKLRAQIGYAQKFYHYVEAHPNLVPVFGPVLNVMGFRWSDLTSNTGEVDQERTNERSLRLMHELNGSGSAYVSHTKWKGWVVVRVVFGQTYLEETHV
ncbi:pyridoxal-dependent decarboxylase, partial [Arthrospira platensis SPKY1]|nr:pyridoxal-dependent decarboxylase [Arthrospira platensis SPKY1]